MAARLGSVPVFEPGVEAAENDGWKGDQEIKNKSDGNGDKNQGEFNGIEYKAFPVCFQNDEVISLYHKKILSTTKSDDLSTGKA